MPIKRYSCLQVGRADGDMRNTRHATALLTTLVGFDTPKLILQIVNKVCEFFDSLCYRVKLVVRRIRVNCPRRVGLNTGFAAHNLFPFHRFFVSFASSISRLSAAA
jgi:hypothetical protein